LGFQNALTKLKKLGIDVLIFDAPQVFSVFLEEFRETIDK